jgi:hypothetical protein
MVRYFFAQHLRSSDGQFVAMILILLLIWLFSPSGTWENTR